MKNLIYFLLALVMLSGTVHSAGLNAVYTKDGVHIIAVGNDGLIFMSYDGGNTWGSYTAGVVHHNSVFAISNKVFICSNSGLIYYSNDGGVNWNASSAGASNLYGIYFADVNTGWVVGSGGAIYKTVNGGVNWTMQSSGVSDNLKDVKFTSATNGVACGSGGKVLYTVNGGTNWQQYTTNTTKNLLSIDQNGTTIIATGEDGFILKYSASLWSMIDYKIQSKSEVRGVAMIDANTFYTCGGGGFINKTVNGGASYVYQPNPMMGELAGIFFFDANKGWAVSYKNNAVMRTVDGGNTWLLPANTNISYSWTVRQASSGNIGNDLCLHPTNKNGVFVASGSTVYRSLDKGQTWTQIATIPYGQSAHSFYVSPRDTNKMLAAIGSSGGRIVRSTDYGATWNVVWGPGSLTPYGMPIEMDPNSPDTVFLGPNVSAVLRSTDFGATWQSNWSSMSFNDPCDLVVLPNHSNVMYLGDQNGGGRFYRSTDYGVTWTMSINAGSAEIPMIAVSSLDPMVVYFTNWSTGGYRKSTDQGVTFTVVNNASSAWGADMAKDDPNVPAFGTYSGGVAYYSTNGGATFINQTIGGSVNYGMLFYDKANLIAQQGSGIYKLAVTYTVTTVTNVNINVGEIPTQFSLEQNYPNPFNPTTNIKFSITKASFVTLKVYDILGKEVRTLINQNMTPGVYSSAFNAAGLPSGTYFYKLVTPDFSDVKKMVLVK